MGCKLGGQVSMFISTRSFAVQGGIRLRSQGGNHRLSFHLHSCHSQTNMAGGPPMDMVPWPSMDMDQHPGRSECGWEVVPCCCHPGVVQSSPNMLFFFCSLLRQRYCSQQSDFSDAAH